MKRLYKKLKYQIKYIQIKLDCCFLLINNYVPPHIPFRFQLGYK